MTSLVDYPHLWEMCVGSSHAAMGLRQDWRDHLRAARNDLGFKFVRFHGLLDDDMRYSARAFSLS